MSSRSGSRQHIAVSRPSDPLEREADLLADHVMRMTEGVVHRACSCDEDDQDAHVSRQAAPGDGGGSVDGSALTLSSAGSALAAPVRSWAESALGRDLSEVRVHEGPDAAAAASSVAARAYTLGRDIVFGRDEYRPDTVPGRRLLAHELAHVLQHGRPPDAVSRTPVTFRGRTFEVGDVVLNARASRDIRTFGNLLPSADQAHILVSGNRLGYEVSYTTPQDPFRWNLLKRIIDNEHVEIRAIDATTTFNALEFTAATGARTTRPITLISFMAGGITLPTLARQQALNPSATVYVASTSATHDQVYYDSGAGGRGLLGGNSLAHELFGHLGLAVQGARFEHGQTVAAASGVTDPFGQPFVGSVNDYISGFAGASSGTFSSPTHRVSSAHLTQALTELTTNGASGLSRNATSWSVTAGFVTNWTLLSINHKALGFSRPPPPATPPTGGPAPTTTPAGTPTTAPGAGSGSATATVPPATAPVTAAPSQASIVRSVATWFGTLNPDQQFAFRQFLGDYLLRLPSLGPTDLTSAVRARLP